MSFISSSPLASIWNKYTYTFTDVAALGASTTGNITVGTFPAKTALTHGLIVVNTPAGTVSTLTVSVGYTASGYTNYFSGRDIMASAGTVYTFAGLNVPDAVNTKDIVAKFDSTGGNLSTVTALSFELWLCFTPLP